jgi:predicted adenine nucleotide alpha hydrolase (AANH) superfamily ATPase
MKKNKILIHTCCADCFLNSLNYLKEESLINETTEIISFFYNPNIHPISEYRERLNALKKILPKNIKLIVPDYRPDEYFEKIKNVNNRCESCWDLRIQKVFEFAKEKEITDVTTTLLVSHYQSRDKILKIGKDYELKYNINFIPMNSSHNCCNKGFYKQNYCGCCFSLVKKMAY